MQTPQQHASGRFADAFRNGRARSYLLADLLADEARAGLLLSVAAVVAVAWASADASGYAGVWQHLTGGSRGVLQLPANTLAWLDEGAMTLFFLVVGLELSRALVHGELSQRRAAILPVVAALGGMAGAGLAYVLVAHSSGTAHGYGIPMATDIAFAVGALGLLGRRVPPALRLFVLALAVADDLGSLAVLVLGYSGHLELPRAAVAAACVVVAVALRRARVRRATPYLVVGLLCWFALVRSGIEPALAGVVVGLSMPPESADAGRLESRLIPITNGLVLPGFAIANVGVDLTGALLRAPHASTVFTAVVVARIAGKCLGVSLATLVAVRLLGGGLGGEVGPRQLLGAGAICGVGFTVPLLVAGRAFGSSPALLDATRLALLVSSVGAFVLGAALLAPARRARARDAAGDR